FAPDALDFGDLSEARADQFLGVAFAGGGNDDVLIVGAVEDAELASGREHGVNAPEVVMGLLCGVRLFEGCGAAMERIDSGEDLANGAVLAGGVHALEHDEERVLLLDGE